MQINFAIPPIFHFRRWLGEFFSLYQSYEISITLSINSLRNYWTFHDSPYLSWKMAVMPAATRPKTNNTMPNTFAHIGNLHWS